HFLQSGNKAAKYILGGLLLLLSASMVTYLIPGFMSGSDVTRSGVVASVAGNDIVTTDVQKAVQRQMQGRQISPDMEAFYRSFLIPQVARQLIQQKEALYEAHRLGLSVSDDEMRDELRNGPGKENFFPGGVWIGQDKYEELLRNANMTPAEFESQMREGMLTQKLFEMVTASVSVNPAEVEKAYKDKNTKVKIEYAVLDRAALAKQLKPTDAELKAFFEANKARYQNSIPEKRQVRYFVLNDSDAEKKVNVTPDKVASYYTQNQDQYRTPDRVRVRHIMIETPKPGPDGKVDQKALDAARAKAEDVLKQVRAGGNFAELANKYSQDPGNTGNKGGELGWITKGQTAPEFEKTAFAQNPGQISDLVQTSYGFHIIQTEEKETAHVKPLSEVKGQIEQLLKAQQASQQVNTDSTTAEQIGEKQGLDKAAAKFGVPVVQSNPISRADVLPGVGPAPDVMGLIFATQANSAPQIARAPQGYVMFQVTRIFPPSTPTLDQIKDKVAADFTNERATDVLQKKIKELADRAHVLHDLAKAAKEQGATVKTSDLVTRTSQIPDFGPMAGQASVAFSMKPGEISGPLNLGDKEGVLQVVDRQEPSATDASFASQRDQLTEQLAQQKRQQTLGLFLDSLDTRLKKEGKLKVNEAEMTALTKTRS
ncbi:MAG TPA: peptidyl-prolyl cis-trans isomerase, partial [Verrucomicrobiae bacterium]|nr:peptidyl-prolyl cis-trans isomerase [Verrucomicrobiae bacterium]